MRRQTERDADAVAESRAQITGLKAWETQLTDSCESKRHCRSLMEANNGLAEPLASQGLMASR